MENSDQESKNLEETKKLVDQQFHKLLKELDLYIYDLRKERKNNESDIYTDYYMRMAFQSWVIRKIAAIEVAQIKRSDPS